jgi:hypothetical protein
MPFKLSPDASGKYGKRFTRKIVFPSDAHLQLDEPPQKIARTRSAFRSVTTDGGNWGLCIKRLCKATERKATQFSVVVRENSYAR